MSADKDRQQNEKAVSDLMDARLPRDAAREALAMLARQPALRRRWRNYQLAGLILRRNADRDEAQADDGFVSAVMQRIRDDESRGDSGKVVQFPHVPPAAEASSLASETADARSESASRTPWAVAAAVAVTAVAIGLLLPQSGSDSGQVLKAGHEASPTVVVAEVVPENKPARTLHIPVPDQRPVRRVRYSDNAQLNAYLLTHSNQAATNIGGALGLVRVAAHTQSGR